MSLPGRILVNTLKRFKYVRGLIDRINEFEKFNGFPPGHYYSALADPAEYITQQTSVFFSDSYLPKEICFNEEKQLEILKSFKPIYDEMPFRVESQAHNRYSFDNDFFTYSDAITLFCMLRMYKPRRIIEIGSGHSSALLLDTNSGFFNNEISLTFIEPNLERLKSILMADEKINIIQKKIQDVDCDLFAELAEGDFLLIDTSHVSKSGGDVNHIYFNILPYLRKGVKIHVHDIFFPFEYPEKWVVEEKRSWNEIFLLRAFLAYNNTFQILFFNDFIQKKQIKYLEPNMPLFLERNSKTCGGIWIEKVK